MVVMAVANLLFSTLMLLAFFWARATHLSHNVLLEGGGGVWTEQPDHFQRRSGGLSVLHSFPGKTIAMISRGAG